MGEGSLIGTTLQLRQRVLRYRQFDRNRSTKSGTVAGGADLAVIRADKGARDPEAEPRTARGRGMSLATCETVPNFCRFRGRQSGALVSDVDTQAVTVRSHGYFYRRPRFRILHGIVENLHQRLLNQNRIDVNQRQVRGYVNNDTPVRKAVAAALNRRVDDVGRLRPFDMRLDAVAADACSVEQVLDIV